MERARLRALAVLLVTTCAACVSYSDVRFAPTIQNAELQDGPEVQARVAVAWRGIEERDGIYEFRLRCRVENPRAQPFTLAPAEFELVDGSLVSLGLARVEGMPAAVEGGAEATFDLAFPVPGGRTPDDFDLSALELRVSFESGRWRWSTSYQRAYPVYGPDPWWGPSFAFGVGVSSCHH